MPGRTFVRFDLQEITPKLASEEVLTSAPAPLDRRTLLQAAAGLVLASAFTATGAAAAQRSGGSADAALAALLQRLAEEQLRRSP